ncbi:MAG: hypothetical protein R3350_07605, partial [Saprospiraceae bacterium]|nr:hypothetical protein [Saprospiraceae bacterium]
DAGFSTWIGLTQSARSVRPYGGLKEVWDMVARTAFTQLRYSPTLLLICTALLFICFLLPVLLLFHPAPSFQILGLTGLLAMMLSYLPTLFFYRLSPLWALSMPFIGLLYLGMTWTSALRYWKGERIRWRGRILYKHSP